MYLDDTGRKAFNRQNGDANFLWKSIQCVHEGLKAGTVPVSDMPQIVLSYLLANGRSLSGVPGINADSLDFAASASPSPAKGRGKQMVATPSTGGRPTVIQPSPARAVAPPPSAAAEVVPVLQQMQAEITTNTKNQQVTAEIQHKSALAHKMILEKLEGVDATLEEHGGDIAILKGQVGGVYDKMGQYEGQMVQFGGRLEALELASPTATTAAAAASDAFSFDGADSGGDKKRPALALVAPAAGDGFGSGATAATTAGISPQGFAAPGPFAVTTAGPGSNKKLPALASLDPAVGGGFGVATAATTTGVPPQGNAAPGFFAGTAAGTNDPGFSSNDPVFAGPSWCDDVANKIFPQAKIAQSIGGAESFNLEYWHMKDSILHFVKDKQALLAQSSEKRLWIYQSSEALDKVTHVDIIETIGSHDVPVFVFTLCELPPTTFVATNSLQLQQRAFYSLQEKNLWWKEVSPRVHILQAVPIAFGQLLDYEYTLLPIMKPSKLYGKETDKSLDSVDVIHNGVLVVASVVSDVDAQLKEEKDEAEEKGRKPRITSEDRPDIVAKLKEKKREEEGLNLSLLENHTSHYHGMIVSHAKLHNIGLSEAASKMESMEMYKIYPSNLPPPKTWDYFQPTGFRKNTMVNRFSGNCDGYYPK